MKITDHIHALKINFQLVFSPEKIVDRSVYAYIVFGEKIHLIDCGVKGSQSQIFDYLEKNGRSKEDVATLVITHSHPDHIGAAVSIKKMTGCRVAYHEGERDWIEDTEKQCRERPIPGFHNLVEGPVTPDVVLNDQDVLKLEEGLELKVFHVPGHSKGSVALFLETDAALVTADALPLPGDLPLYEDIGDSIASIKKLQALSGVRVVFSSWEDPIQDETTIRSRMDESLQLFYRIHRTVCAQVEPQQSDMDLCQKVVTALSLPPVAVNPIMAKAFASSVKYCGSENFFN